MIKHKKTTSPQYPPTLAGVFELNIKKALAKKIK
jgi:hypothetical protein